MSSRGVGGERVPQGWVGVSLGLVYHPQGCGCIGVSLYSFITPLDRCLIKLVSHPLWRGGGR